VATVREGNDTGVVNVKAVAVAANLTIGHQVTVIRAGKEEGIEMELCIKRLQLFRSESHSGSESSMEEEYGVRKETLLHGVSLWTTMLYATQKSNRLSLLILFH